MDISKIDKNFAVEKFEGDDSTRFYDLPCEPFDLYGVFYEKETGRFVRLPSEIAAKVNDGVAYSNKCTAGGRVRFSTDSATIALFATYPFLNEMDHMPLTGSAGLTLLEETDNGFKHIKTFMPKHTAYGKEYANGYSGVCKVAGGEMKNYILFFPLYNHLNGLKIGLDAGAKVSHGKKYRDIKPVLYYGSSVTQGGCASRPDNSYQAIISKRNNVDFINLGFSGSARAETAMCEYLASVNCSVFVCDYDYNAPDKEFLEKTHYPLYKTFRKAQPDTPIVFISKPSIEHDENYAARFGVIKETYLKARAEGDTRVYLIDGKTFFGDDDRNACTVDGTHPNDLGFYKMAQGIAEVLDKILG